MYVSTMFMLEESTKNKKKNPKKMKIAEQLWRDIIVAESDCLVVFPHYRRSKRKSGRRLDKLDATRTWLARF